MTWRRFRNKIEKDMREHQSPVDIDAIWANIEPDVDRINEEKKKKRRFIFFWWLLGIALVGFLAGLLLTMDNNRPITTSSSSTEASVVETNTQSNKTTDQTTTNNTLQNNEINALTENKNQTDKNQTDNNQIDNKNQNTTIKTNKETERTASYTAGPWNPPTTNKQTTGTSSNQQTDISSTVQQSTGAPIYTYTPRQTMAGTTSYTTPKQPVTVYKSDHSTVITTNQSGNNGQTPIGTGQTTITKPKKTVLPSGSKASTEESKTQDLQLLPVKEMELIIPPFRPVRLHDSLMGIAKKLSDKQPDLAPQKQFEFLVGLEGGIGYAFSSVGVLSDSLPLAPDSRRNETETMLETSYMGIQIGAQHKSGLELLTGFGRTEVTERFDFADSVKRNFMVQHVDSIFLSVNGDTLSSLASYILTETTLYEKRIFNRYTFYDIPISLGFHRQVNHNWRIGARAGVLVNLALKTKGTIMTGLGEFADIKTDQADYYKSKIGLNYTGEVALGRRLGKHAWLTLSPFVRYTPQNLTVDTYNVSHKQLLVGGKLGLQFRF